MKKKVLMFIASFVLMLGAMGFMNSFGSIVHAATSYSVSKAANGNWYYYEKGVIKKINTVAKNSKGWWVIRNGKVDFGYTGFAKNSKGWWYCKGGKVQFGKNDVLKGTVNGENAWWHVVNGKVIFDETVAQNSKGWWHIQNGKVNFESNTVAKNSKGWWVIRNGKVDFGYTGFAKNSKGWWYCKGGKVQFEKNDVLKGTVNGENAWWHVVNGKVIFDETVAQNSKGWWHIQNGKVNFDSNTVAKNSKGWWMIRNGEVDFSFSGLASNQNGLWYIEKGKVNFDYNGVVIADDKTVYDVKKGSAIEFGEKVVELVNKERATYGLSPLISDKHLKKAACVRAQELTRLFDHTRPDGKDSFSVLDDFGISYRCAGENIAGGQFLPEMVVYSWMNSTGHRKNILNAEYSKIGVGCYYDESSKWGMNWVQIFTD